MTELDRWHHDQEAEATARWAARIRATAGALAILAAAAALASCVFRVMS